MVFGKKYHYMIKWIGAVIIILLGILTHQGAIERNIFSTLVLITLLTIFIIEFLLKKYFYK